MGSESVKTMKQNVAIIGSGQFGCAIFSALKKAGQCDLMLIAKESSDINEIAAKNKININNIDNDLSILKNYDTIFLTTPSAYIEEIINKINKTIKQNVNIVLCSKGKIDPLSSMTLKNKIPNANVYVFAGPSFADEIIQNHETLVTLATNDTNNVGKISDLFNGSCIKIKESNDIHGTEIAGALKNILGIYSGYMMAQNIGRNTMVKEMLEIIYESEVLFNHFNAKINTLLEPCGLGDIMLTCFSDKSRNQRFGMLLHENILEAKKMLKINIIEGIEAIKSIKNIINNKNLNMPKISHISDIILQKIE